MDFSLQSVPTVVTKCWPPTFSLILSDIVDNFPDSSDIEVPAVQQPVQTVLRYRPVDYEKSLTILEANSLNQHVTVLVYNYSSVKRLTSRAFLYGGTTYYRHLTDKCEVSDFKPAEWARHF